MLIVIPGEPMGKPRMTRCDKWAKRPCVERYREWADHARRCAFGKNEKQPQAPVRVNWCAYFEMPASWSKAKRDAHRGQAHRQRSDRDNVDKALLDALYADDSTCAFGDLRKFWDDGAGPRLEVYVVDRGDDKPITAAKHLLTARRGAR